MMTATQVFGARAGHAAALHARSVQSIPETKPIPAVQPVSYDKKTSKGHGFPAGRIKTEAKNLISRHLGILRDEKGLKRCVSGLKEMMLSFECDFPGKSRPYFEARNSLLVGELIANSALEHDKSLGSHYRADFPPMVENNKPN